MPKQVKAQLRVGNVDNDLAPCIRIIAIVEKAD